MRQGRGWALPDLEDGRRWMASVTRTMLEGGEAKDENLFTRQSLVKEAHCTAPSASLTTSPTPPSIG